MSEQNATLDHNVHNEHLEMIKKQQIQIKSLIAQLEAHKQLLNESNNNATIVRTNFILFQQAHQELNQMFEQQKAFLDVANKTAENLNAEIVKVKNELELAKMDNESLRNALNNKQANEQVIEQPIDAA